MDPYATIGTLGGPFRGQVSSAGSAPAAVLVSSYALDAGSAVDAQSGINGTVVGSWTSVSTGSLVVGDAGTSMFKAGGTAHITLPANQAAHNLTELSIRIYYQPNASDIKHILFAAGNGTAIGHFSIERLTNGRLRGWHVGNDGGLPSLRYFESTDGIAATNLVVGTAYRVVVTFGPAGAKLYLDDALVSSIPQNTNGWDNTAVKYIGIWVDAVQAPLNGIVDQIDIWNGQLELADVVALADAQSIVINDHNTLVMAAPGQVSDAFLEAADVYYKSTDVTTTIRDSWNSQVLTDRDNFATAHTIVSRTLNSKTRNHNRNFYHEAVIEPASAFSSEVLFPPGFSQPGVLRMTSRNKTGWGAEDGGADDNFRKHAINLRRIDTHSAYTSINSGTYDFMISGLEYEVGFTFWLGGTTNWIENIASLGSSGSTALCQCHSNNQVWLYFQVGSTGFISCSFGNGDGTGGGNHGVAQITAGHDDIHVVKIQFKIGSAGYIKIWYNNVQYVNATHSLGANCSNRFNEFFVYRTPFPVGGGVEATVYMDRVWRRAL